MWCTRRMITPRSAVTSKSKTSKGQSQVGGRQDRQFMISAIGLGGARARHTSSYLPLGRIAFIEPKFNKCVCKNAEDDEIKDDSSWRLKCHAICQATVQGVRSVRLRSRSCLLRVSRYVGWVCFVRGRGDRRVKGGIEGGAV
jgi:hypothetical protein